MSAEQNQNTPLNMDDDEQRRKNLTESLQSMTFDDDDAKTSVSATTPTPKPKPKSTFAQRLAEKANASKQDVSPSPVPTQAPNATGSVPVGVSGTFSAPQKVDTGANSYSISGKIVGSAAKDPEWTQQQLIDIAARCAYRLDTVLITDSRRTEPDREQRFVRRLPNGTVTAGPEAALPDLPLDQIILAIGAAKPDNRIKPALYSDVIIVGKNKDWTLNQWVVKDVIMEPVPSDVRKRGMGGPAKQSKRTIGVHFARFGFPIYSLGPVFNTLAATMPGLMDDLTITPGYYYHNASWGVSTTPASFAYKDEHGKIATTPHLNEAMELIGTRSSLGMGTFAISISCEYETQNGKIVANSNKYKFSIKCHNFYHVRATDYHGPPQTTAVGFSLSEELASQSEVLKRPAVMGSVLQNTDSLFGTSSFDTNPFMSAMGNHNNNKGSGTGQNTASFGGLL